MSATRPYQPPACAWCDAALAEGAVRRPGRITCPRCGVATTDPWPGEAELAAAYGSWYRPESGRFSGAGDRFLRRSRGLLARRLDREAPPGRVLDVGAGDGALLDALHAAGREALGLERYAARPDVVDTPLEDLEGEFAAVVFWHSLEHLPRPAEALGHAAGLLAPGGLLVVAIPNSDSLQARAFGDRWLALDLPRHLVHVPAAALRRRLVEEGLRVERVSHLRGGQVAVRLAARPGGPAAGAARSLRRHPAPGRPPAPARPPAPGGDSGGRGAAPPAAAAASAAEALLRRGGTVYVEARRD